jgi:hypothetical protein
MVVSSKEHLKDKCLDLRLDAMRAAQDRSRFALLAVSIASLALLVAGWNAYFGYYGQFAMEQNPTPTGENQVAEKLRSELYSEWVKSRMITISLLGLHVGVDDATTVGAVAMWIVLYWLELCMRREHYSIAHLFRDYRGGSQEERTLVFYAVNAYTVFTNVQHSDIPLRSLDEPFRPNQWTHTRLPTLLMFWFPVIALVLLIAMDIASVFYYHTPFRDNWAQTPYEAMRAKGTLGLRDIAMIFFWDVVAVVLLIPAGILCYRIVRFNNATEHLLRDFWKNLVTDYGHDFGVQRSETLPPD